jgi:transcriptional regulator with XRE-family HTH domain
MDNPISNNIFAQAEKDPGFWLEDFRLEFMEELAREMKHLNISRTELAKRIGVSPAYITKILRGDSNFTLQSMVKLAFALGSKLCIRMEPIDQGICEWKVLAADVPGPQETTLSYRGHKVEQPGTWGSLPAKTRESKLAKPLSGGEGNETGIKHDLTEIAS